MGSIQCAMLATQLPAGKGKALGVALCPTLAGQRGVDLCTHKTGRAFVHFRAGKQS